MRVVSEDDYQLLLKRRGSCKVEEGKRKKMQNLVVDGGFRNQMNSVLVAMNTKDDKMLSQAWTIMKYLLEAGALRWNQQGEITYRGQYIKESDVVELLVAVLKMDPEIVNMNGGLIFVRALLDYKDLIFKKIRANVVKFINQMK